MALVATGTQETSVPSPRQKFEGHTDWVNNVIHIPGGRRILTCSSDGSRRVWDLESGKQIGNDWRDGERAVYSIALSMDGKKAICGSGDGEVRVWDIDSGKVITRWSGHKKTVRSLCWNRDGGRVVSGSWDGTARVWDVESGETILTIKTGLTDVLAVLYSPDETMIATGGDNDEKEFLNIWNSKTGKRVKNLRGHIHEVNCLAWTTDGGTLISGSWDESILTWNTTTWQQVLVLKGHTSSVDGIAISPNGRILASGASWDKTARLWNLENGQHIGSPLQHAKPVNSVSFSADGKLLATGCDDNNAYTWDVSEIVRDAGCNQLLLNTNDRDKTLLDVVAPRQTRENARRLPPTFFDDSPHRPRSPGSHRQSPPSARQYHPPEHTLLARVSSLFQRNHYNTDDTLRRPRFPDWVRSPLSSVLHRRHDEDIDLQESRPAVVDVPFARGRRRNISGAEIRLEREKAKKAKKNKTFADSLRPSKTSVTHQSDGAAQTQPTSQLTPPSATATTSTNSRPGVLVTNAGRWTRFRLFICCVSTQYTDGHH